jgi:restriction endonuclease Mrr
VYVTGRFAGNVLPGPATLAVDCKCWSSTVNVPDVERFMGLLEDIRADLGLIITTTGFSAAAQARATHGRGVHIEVITFEDLELWNPPDVNLLPRSPVE